MLLKLPLNLFEKIIRLVIYPIRKCIKTLLILLRTCRATYALVIPHLYHTLPLHADLSMDAVLHPLLPDCKRRGHGPFLSSYTVPHTCVKNLLILLQREHLRDRNPPFPNRTLLNVFTTLTAIHTLVYTPKNCGTRRVHLPEAIAALHFRSLTCRYDSPLLSSDLSSKRNWALEKLTLYKVGVDPTILKSILEASACTLRELYLTYTDATVSHSGLPELHELRALRLLRYGKAVIEGLQGMAFEQLHTLQLVSRDGGGTGIAKGLESGGGLGGLRKLSLGMGVREMVQILELCGASLREAHFVHMGESGTPTEWSAVIEVLARRCRGLSAVSLDAEANIKQPPQFGFPTDVGGWAREDITKLAVGCPDIRDLRFAMDLNRWSFENYFSRPHTNPPPALFSKLENLYITLAHLYNFNSDIYLPIEPTFLDVGPQLPAQLWAVIDELGGREKMEEHWSIATWGNLVESRKDGIGNPLLSELREKLVFPVVGKGKWTEAFEPAWLGEERFKTGVLM